MKFKLTSAVLLLLGFGSVLGTQTMDDPAHSCDTTIQRIFERNLNFEAIQKSPEKWSDVDFKPLNKDALVWLDNSEGKTNLKEIMGEVIWKRLSEIPQETMATSQEQFWFEGFEGMKAPSLFGDSKDTADVLQGDLRDGYFLAACASLFEKKEVFQNLFGIKDLSEGNGAIPVNLYPGGKKQVVMIDDYLPFRQEKIEKDGKTYGPYKFIFARPGSDGSVWAPLLEKAWAKISGTYNNIELGLFNEAGTLLTGAPGNSYTIKDTEKDQIWNHINTRIRNYMLAASLALNGESKKNELGLAYGHTYTILSTHSVVTDQQKNTTTHLIRFRNHWGGESYTGPWNDNDQARWTDAVRSQVGDAYTNNLEDGIFFVDLDTFMGSFESYSILYYNERYIQSDYEIKEDQGKFYYFHFDETEVQDNLYIMVQTANERMLPSDCFRQTMYATRSSVVKISLTDHQNNTLIAGYKDLSRGYAFIELLNLQPGKYIVSVNIEWAQDYYRNFVVRAYGDHAISLEQFELNYDNVVKSGEQVEVSERHNGDRYRTEFRDYEYFGNIWSHMTMINTSGKNTIFHVTVWSDRVEMHGAGVNSCEPRVHENYSKNSRWECQVELQPNGTFEVAVRYFNEKNRRLKAKVLQ